MVFNRGYTDHFYADGGRFNGSPLSDDKLPAKKKRRLKIDRIFGFSLVTGMAGRMICLVIYICMWPSLYPASDVTNDRDELSARIEAISSDLEKSAKETDAIQEKLESRIATVEELKKEAPLFCGPQNLWELP